MHPALRATDEPYKGDGGAFPSIKVAFPWTLKDMLSWENGKWQEALLTQPPQKKVRIQITDGDPQELVFGGALKPANHKFLEVGCEEGVRFGQVVEELRALVYPGYSHRAKKGGKKKKCPRSCQVRTRFPLERYEELSFVVEGAVLPDDFYVETAVEFEEEFGELHG